MRSTNRICVAATMAAIACLTGCSSSTTGRGASTKATLQPTLPTALPTALPSGHTPASSATATPSAGAAIPDACTLLTRKEAEAVAGVALQAAEDTRAAQESDVASCTYNAPPTGASGSITVFAQLQLPDALTTDRNLGHRFHNVAGIADQAVEEQNNLFMRKGTLWVTVSSAYSTSPGSLERAARIVAGRL